MTQGTPEPAAGARGGQVSGASRPRRRPPLPSWTREIGWVLLPLRLFLGFTFTYAGLDKIADRGFLNDDDPTSLHQTVLAVKDQSPIEFMLGPIVSHSAAFGVAIAIAETAVGLGLLTGFLTRLAALGGMALTFGLFLTVSWSATPWYTGADLVYTMALTPLVLGGAGAVLSLDGWLAGVAERHARESGGSAAADRTRRGLLAAGLGFAGLLGLGAAALSRGSERKAAGAPASDSPTGSSTPSATPTPAMSSASPPPSGTSTTAPTASPVPTGEALVATSAVAVGGAKLVRNPDSGDDDIWVMQLKSGEFTAVSGVCPHQGCIVNFVDASTGFTCPCHQSRFSASGARLSGAATRSLAEVDVEVGGGQVHLA